MNSDRRQTSIAPPPSLLAADDVLDDLIRWQSAGLRTALVSLVAVEGASPRPLGAQMAIAENGLTAGYLSGGCIEQSVAEEARRAIAQGENRLIRYGKGSAYFDIKLPCGSGLDLYFDQALASGTVAAMAERRRERQPFVHKTNLHTGASTILSFDGQRTTRLTDGVFHRIHLPLPRVVLVGGGPAFTAIAQLLSAAGFELDIATPDAIARTALEQCGLSARGLTDPRSAEFSSLDAWTAAVLAFHEHDWETPVLAEILRSPCFYVGAMGGQQAHANRLAQLTEMGVPAELQSRIRSPIGLIPGAKSRSTLAVGILAELVAQAKAAGILA
jgi:xanthine dehydrogenase accessory factor